MINVCFRDRLVQTAEIVLELSRDTEIGGLEQNHDQHDKRNDQLIEDPVLLDLTQLLEPCQPTELFFAKQLECSARRSLRR